MLFIEHKLSDSIKSRVANFTHFELSQTWAFGQTESTQRENQKHFNDVRGISDNRIISMW